MRDRNRTPRIGIIPATILLTALITDPAHATAESTSAARHEQAIVKLDQGHEIPAISGIQPLGIRLSAGGYMLDFRYRVLDPQAAADIIRRDVDPYLVEEGSGSILRVPAPPKVGPLRHTGKNMMKDRGYFILFANPAKRIRPGDKVTLIMGEHRISQLVVR